MTDPHPADSPCPPIQPQRRHWTQVIGFVDDRGMTETPTANDGRAFLILHGWQNHRPAAHWQHWLADRLTDLGHEVAYPQLPEPDDPDLERWLA